MLRFRKDYYQCPMHRLVRNKSKELLDEIGEFSFERVLTECKLESLSEYIRWDYVCEEMEESGYDLMPGMIISVTLGDTTYEIPYGTERVPTK